MVEITYQMVLSTLQTAGILVGIFYYIMTLRNAEKARELTLKSQEHATETRQAQLYMQFFNRFSSEEGSDRALELLETEWENYEDFDRKYGIKNNRKFTAKRNQVFTEHDVIGYLLHKGLLDIDMVYQMNGYATTLVWNHFESIIKEQRRQFGWSDWMMWFEYLANEINEYRKNKPRLDP